MADLARLESALRAADAAGDTEAATKLAQAYRSAKATASEPSVNPAEGMSTTERFVTGMGGAAARLRDQIFPPGNPVNALSMGTLGRDDTLQRKDDLATYERNKEALGTAGKVGEVATEIAASSIPISRASTIGGHVLKRAIGRMAPATADIAANAGYSALTAEPDQRGEAAGWGAAGAAGGRVLTRALGGIAKPFVSKEAKELMEQGVTPTPGQLFGDGPLGSSIRSFEDKASSIPLVGEVVNYARGRSIGDYGRAEVNRAINPLAKKVSGVGTEAVEKAQKLVSEQYDQALPHVNMPAKNVVAAVDDGIEEAMRNPLLDPRQANVLTRYKARLQTAMDQGVDGQLFKQIDSEMGYNGRKFLSSPNPEDHALGEAFYDLQASWRYQLEQVAPEGIVGQIKAANAAHRNMLPIVKASDKASAQGGRFTPNQLKAAGRATDVDAGALNEAGQAVLPGRIPDSGSAGRLLFGALGTGVGTAMTGLAPAATAGGIAAVIYSRPGVNFLVNGLGGMIPNKLKSALLYVTPKEAIEHLDLMAQAYPQMREALQQLTAQMGRQLATQEQPAEAAP